MLDLLKKGSASYYSTKQVAKDTGNNIRRTGEFVVNLVSDELAEATQENTGLADLVDRSYENEMRFGRVLATAAVLGSGLLGDVYQTANMIPNLLFELVALGVLQSVLLRKCVAGAVLPILVSMVVETWLFCAAFFMNPGRAGPATLSMAITLPG